MENYVQRFLFEDLFVRGAFMHLGSLWRTLQAGRNYPVAVMRLLGQMTAVSTLLTDNLKQQGRLTLQLRSEGAISLMVVDCSSSLNLRCMAHYGEDIAPFSTKELFAGGKLSLIYDTEVRKEPYQSIVPTEAETIARIFEHYLKQSEQIITRFFIAASQDGVSAFFLQKMPGADDKDADAWSRLEALASTVREEELLNLPSESLLERLFHEEKVRVFQKRGVLHHFPQDWERVGNMLRALGRDEVYRVLEQNGEIAVRDDLSNHDYRFDKNAIDALFVHMPVDSKAVH